MVAAWVVLGLLLIPLVHEGGHALVGQMCGHPLRWSFGWGRLRIWKWEVPIPRGLWTVDLPEGNPLLVRVRRAGFRAEFAVAGVALALVFVDLIPMPLGMSYCVGALLHRALYPRYAGVNSDLT